MKKGLLLLFLVGLIAFNVSSTFSITSDNDTKLFTSLENQNNANFSEGETTWYYCWNQFDGGILWPKQCGCCCALPFTTPVGFSMLCAEPGGPTCPID